VRAALRPRVAVQRRLGLPLNAHDAICGVHAPSYDTCATRMRAKRKRAHRPGGWRPRRCWSESPTKRCAPGSLPRHKSTTTAARPARNPRAGQFMCAVLQVPPVDSRHPLRSVRMHARGGGATSAALVQAGGDRAAALPGSKAQDPQRMTPPIRRNAQVDHRQRVSRPHTALCSFKQRAEVLQC
jgi:hypothetical protein